MSERFILNETSYFGRGSRVELANEIKTRGFNKVLFVTDKSLLECGVASKVTEVLTAAGIEYSIYSEIKPNPTVKNVQDGVNACREYGADVIVAVGGGSVMDTAKGISIIMTNPDRYDVVSLEGLSNTAAKGMPMIALPTTHGTAAEVTINYVITDEERQVKMVCVDPNDIPVLAIVDSELMETLPKGTAAATGLDALTHAVEGYITKGHNLMADMFHMRAIELIFANLAKAVNEKDQDAIEYDTPHGIANAILLPTVMRFNGVVCADRFREIISHLGRTDAYEMNDQDVINTFVWMIEELSKSVGVTQRVADVGGKEEDIEMLADKAMADACRPGNPREVTKEDFIRLYKEAM